jgi:hypothetical protein
MRLGSPGDSPGLRSRRGVERELRFPKAGAQHHSRLAGSG